MVDRAETVWKAKNGIYFRAEFGEVEVSKDDVVTFDGFSSTDNLLEAYFIKKSDGSEMTCTHVAYNVVTITGTGSNIDCVYLVYGFKA